MQQHESNSNKPVDNYRSQELRLPQESSCGAGTEGTFRQRGTNTAASFRSGILKPGGGARAGEEVAGGGESCGFSGRAAVAGAFAAAIGDQAGAEVLIFIRVAIGTNIFASVESFLASSLVCRCQPVFSPAILKTEAKGWSKLQTASDSGGCVGTSSAGMIGGASVGGGGGVGGVALPGSATGSIDVTSGLARSEDVLDEVSPEAVSQSDSDASSLLCWLASAFVCRPARRQGGKLAATQEPCSACISNAMTILWSVSMPKDVPAPTCNNKRFRWGA